MTYLWEEHQEDVGWGFLLFNVRNTFTDFNQTYMLYHVLHKWTSGYQFIFNTYRHWKLTILQGCVDLVHCKELVTEGNPLVLILYRLRFLLTIQALKHHIEDTK